MATPRTTVWILGDQLGHHLTALAEARPATHRVLLIESASLVASKRWHIQRLHLVLAAMHRFAGELVERGFEVDLRRADSLADGLRAHCDEFTPTEIVATEPNSRGAVALLQRLAVTLRPTNQFLCHPDDFATWAQGRRTFKMEDFYRWQRRRLGYLMDGDQPAEGRWNFDADNRQPPPKPGTTTWPQRPRQTNDELDNRIIAQIRDDTWGAAPDGTWATDRAGALSRLDHFIDRLLPHFGPFEDAMTTESWHLHHGMLAQYLNIGLLTPAEICDRVEAEYRAGRVPIASAEGCIRQIIGWREYVWGLYWLWGDEYAQRNMLEANRPLPPVFTGAPTQMRCVGHTLQTLYDHGWVHHIQRLMILGNLALLAGVVPQEMTDWMWAGFVDGAEWVMVPNVVGMALHADGGMMATKPYAAGGAYIDRMSDYCRGCRFDRKQRTGPDACPFTTLYWDFLGRHTERFDKNPRIVQQVRAAQKLSDLPAVRERAAEVLQMLDDGLL